MTYKTGKNMLDENFPVAALVNKKLRHIVISYYLAARCADNIADNSLLNAEEKLNLLSKAEKEFYAGLNQQNISANSEAYKLGQIFAQENLHASLYTDLLRAFEKDAKNQPIEIWEQLIDYCRFSAAPVGRFILALHDESPTAYLQAEILCAVLQISNHLQDLHKDIIELRRCYLPIDMMKKYQICLSDLYLSKSSQRLKDLIAEITGKLKKMLKDAEILPALVKSWRLKAQIGIILSLTNSMIKRIEKGDVLAQSIKLNTWDWLKAFVIGAIKGLWQRTKKTGKIL